MISFILQNNGVRRLLIYPIYRSRSQLLEMTQSHIAIKWKIWNKNPVLFSNSVHFLLQSSAHLNIDTYVNYSVLSKPLSEPTKIVGSIRYIRELKDLPSRSP